MCVLKFEPTASWGRSVGFEGLFDGIKESLPVACGFVVRERRGTFFDRMICGVLDISLVGIFLVGNAVVLDWRIEALSDLSRFELRDHTFGATGRFGK